MKLFSSKRGIGLVASNAVNTFIGIVVLLLLAANFIPEMVNAGNNVSATGVPLAALFAGTGLVILLIMVGLFLTVVKLAGLGKK